MSEAAVLPEPTQSEFLSAPQLLPMPRRRVLVTGAGGMLATDLVPVLAGAGWDVFARPRKDLDIRSEHEVTLAFREIRPEVVVNCAAYTKVDACETDPEAFEVNARGVENLAAEAIRHSAQLVQISTDFVFDGRKATPYTEEDPVSPLSAYGASKQRGEEAALRVPTGLVVRSSWLFGLGGWNFVEAILRQVEGGSRRLTVVQDQRGRPTGTIDLSEAVLALLQVGAIGIYHFANRGERSWFEFAQDILALSGYGNVEVLPIDSETLARPARRPEYSVLNTSRYEMVTSRPIRGYRAALIEYLSRRPRLEA
jgi:dTDP-4-dehydrorhamnose reductase